MLKDDGGPEIVAIEAGDKPASLWIRVGPVWDDDRKRDEPGVWICYQQRHMATPPAGPVLLTPADWRELVVAVERRLRERRRRRSWWRRPV